MSQSFRLALQAAGLHPRDIEADGRIRRCSTDSKPGKRNGWYVLHPDGHGAWGDWTSGSSDALGHWRDERSTADPAAQAAAAERMRQQREAERAARRQAIGGARRFWERARACTRLHPYLAAKGLSALGTQPLREADGLLVVPVMWRGSLISVQTISPDGAKRFWPGAPVKSGCVVLDRPRAALTVICEGLATGLAVFQAVRHARVVVAFDAGNLLPVVQEIRPTGSVVLAADNDHGTAARRGFNPGLEKARNAAELIGAGVAAPEGIEGTDWADALREWGPAGVKRIERLVQAGARYVAPQLENTS
jgi:putative DNA primase/helicase